MVVLEHAVALGVILPDMEAPMLLGERRRHGLERGNVAEPNSDANVFWERRPVGDSSNRDGMSGLIGLFLLLGL